MLTSRDYFNQILEWHKNGQKDLIRESARKRSQANRAIQRGKLFADEEVFDKEEKRV